MKHADVEMESLLDLYVMRRLEPGREEELEEHILACPACTAEVDRRRAFVDGVRALGPAARKSSVSGWRNLAIAASALLAVSVPLSIWSISGLQDQRARVAELIDMGSAVQTMTLVQVRGGETAETPNIIERGPEAGWLLMTLEGSYRPGAAYRVSIASADTSTDWRHQVRADDAGLLMLGLPTNHLEPGRYAVEVQPVDGASEPRQFEMRLLGPGGPHG